MPVKQCNRCGEPWDFDPPRDKCGFVDCWGSIIEVPTESETARAEERADAVAMLREAAAAVGKCRGEMAATIAEGLGVMADRFARGEHVGAAKRAKR